MDEESNKRYLLLYTSDDGAVRVEVPFHHETFWLTQKQMADLFCVDVRTISYHIKNIFQSNELEEISVVQKNWITAADGKQYNVVVYNLDVVISVGYRVNSIRGTQFRIWATQRLKEYLVKGFTMNDEFLKNNGDTRYFEELLERIRDIRSSEKIFSKKILEIYATSIDYDAKSETTQAFFKVIQNKLHWGAHGHTASEIIHRRANADEPNMGLTTWGGARITKQDTTIAKNYLTQEELEHLNRIVTAYLEFAEVQAMNRNPMTMQAWIDKLDAFLNLSDRDILRNAGTISQKVAQRKAHEEYEKFRQQRLKAPTPIETDFHNAVQELGSIEKITKKNITRRRRK